MTISMLLQLYLEPRLGPVAHHPHHSVWGQECNSMVLHRMPIAS